MPGFVAVDRNVHGLIDERIGSLRAAIEGRTVHERLERRTGLTARLLHVIERVLRKITAVDPRLDLSLRGSSATNAACTRVLFSHSACMKARSAKLFERVGIVHAARAQRAVWITSVNAVFLL